MRFGADTGSGVDSERPSPEAVVRWAGEFAKCRLARRSGRAGLGNGFDPVDEVIGGA